MTSTPSASNQRRATADAMSALFWWSCRQDLDRVAEHVFPEVRDGHADRDDTAQSTAICVEAGLVVQHPDAQRLALCLCRSATERRHRG